MRQYDFELTGTFPLLMHADNIEGADELQAWRKDPANKNLKVAGDDRSPAWTWQTYVYSDGEHVAMPVENIMVGLRKAGTQVIMSGKKTFKEISQSGMRVTGEFCRFYSDGKQVPIEFLDSIREKDFENQADAVRDYGFRLWAKRAVIGSSKHIRVRPRFDKWSVNGTLMVWANEITDKHIRQIFEIAGSVGLCDWRPGGKTPGPFGTYTVKLTEC